MSLKAGMEKIKSLQLTYPTWLRLQQLKLKRGAKSMDVLLKDLLDGVKG